MRQAQNRWHTYKMIEKLGVNLILSLTLIGCSKSNDCDDQLRRTVQLEELYSDSTKQVLMNCGGLDSIDLKILLSPTITEIVNTTEFQEENYDYNQLVSDFMRFRDSELYSDLRITYVLKGKTFASNDWPTDSIQLVRIFDLPPDDIAIIKKVISDPNNKQMTYSEAFKEMNKIQIQRSVNNIGRMMKEK